MKLGFFLSVLCFCFLNECIAGALKHRDWQPEPLEIPAVDVAVELVTQTTELLSSVHFEEFFPKAMHIAVQLSSFLEPLNALVKVGVEIVDMITEKSDDPLKKLQGYIGEQFAIVNGKLELIESKIDRVNLVFRDELAQSKIREYLHKRNNIREMLVSFSKNPNKITTYQLKKVCESNSMREFINFLNGEIVDGGEGSLLAAMKRGQVRKTFFQWTKNIYGWFVEATVLYSHCFTTTFFKNFDKKDFNKTLKVDTETYQEMLKKLVTKLEEEHKEFLKPENYMDWAKHDVREMMTRHRGMNHPEFARIVTESLSDKYDFRAWLVGSYDGGTIGLDQQTHTETIYRILVTREENRSVVALSLKKYNESSPEREDLKDLSKQLAEFLSSNQSHVTLNQASCKNVHQIITSQFSGLSVHCIRGDKNPSVRHSPEALLTMTEITIRDHNGITRFFSNTEECIRWYYKNVSWYKIRRPHCGPFVSVIITKLEYM